MIRTAPGSLDGLASAGWGRDSIIESGGFLIAKSSVGSQGAKASRYSQRRGVFTARKSIIAQDTRPALPSPKKDNIAPGQNAAGAPAYSHLVAPHIKPAIPTAIPTAAAPRQSHSSRFRRCNSAAALSSDACEFKSAFLDSSSKLDNSASSVDCASASVDSAVESCNSRAAMSSSVGEVGAGCGKVAGWPEAIGPAEGAACAQDEAEKASKSTTANGRYFRHKDSPYFFSAWACQAFAPRDRAISAGPPEIIATATGMRS